MRGLLTQKRCCCLCLVLCLGAQCPFVDGPGWEGMAPPGPANSGTSQSRLISHDSQSVTQVPPAQCLPHEEVPGSDGSLCSVKCSVDAGLVLSSAKH